MRTIIGVALAAILLFAIVRPVGADEISRVQQRANTIMIAALEKAGIKTSAAGFDYEVALADVEGLDALALGDRWFKSVNPYLRAAGAFLYGVAAEREETASGTDAYRTNLLAAMLAKDGSDVAKIAAANAMGKIGARRGPDFLWRYLGEEALAKALTSPLVNVDVRSAAAWALSDSKSARLVKVARLILVPELEGTLGVELAAALGALDNRDASAFLMTIADGTAGKFPAAVRNEAIVQLSGRLGHINPAKLIRLAAAVDDEETADRLVNTLMGDREDKVALSPRLTRILSNSDRAGLKLLGLKARGDESLWIEAGKSALTQPRAVMSFLGAWAGALPDGEKSETTVRRMGALAMAIAAVAAPGTETATITLFEELRGRLPEGLKDAFDDVIREERRAAALALYKKRDSCETACEIAKNDKVWSSPAFLSPEYPEKHLNSWEMAMRSLGAAFLAKASGYCEPAKKRWDELKKKWLGFPDCTPESLDKADAGLRAARAVTAKLGRPAYVQDVFAEQYYSLLLRESLKDGKLSDACRKAVGERLAASEAVHAKYVGAASRAEDDVNEYDSLYTSYALAASVLSLPSPSRLMLWRMRRLVEKTGDPTRIPYYPKLEAGSSRASAARSPAFLLALYFHEDTAKDKEGRRKELLRAVRNYARHVPSLSLHVGREETHVGGDDLAPYYFYSTIPYTIAATRLLIARSRNDVEKKELEEILGELTGTLLGMMEKQGVVRQEGERPSDAREGKGGYDASPIYVNPLAGLALLAVKACVPGATATELGVVSPELERREPPPKPSAPKDNH